MKLRHLFLLSTLLVFCGTVDAQLKLTPDTIGAPYIGFQFGTSFASDKFSTDNGMHDLYPNPYLGFGLDAGYKFKSNWMLFAEGSLIFGTDMNDKTERMPAVYSRDNTPIVIGTNGTDAQPDIYNRALSLRIGGGRVFTLDSRNPNSGIMLRASAGYMQQKTIFMMYKENAPQLEGDYARLYDHKRRGMTLSESVGYWFMSNSYSYFNFYVAFEVTQCWNSSPRDYVIDEVMGLHGPDNTKYFDLLYTIKLCWLFPLKGKTAYDYYFF